MIHFKWPTLGAHTKGWTALDIGTDGALHAVSVRRGPGGRPQVMKYAHRAAGLPLAQALAQVDSEVSVFGFAWALALQRGQYQMLVMAEPAVLAGEMEQSLRWALGALIDYPVEEAHLSWLRIPTAAFQANRAQQLYAIVARHTLIKAQQSLFQQCKLKLQALDVRETAQRNIAALIEKKGEGLGLLHVSANGVGITFTFDGELYLDRFIEQSLQELLAADHLQRHSLFERIALQVSRSIDFIARNYSFMPIGRIVLAPLPQPMGLRDYLASNLSLPVEQLDLATVFDMALTPALAKPDAQWPFFSALGTALRSTGSTV